MSSPSPPPNRLVTLLRSVMGNATWDAIKNLGKLAYDNWPLLVLAMGVIASSIATAIDRLRGIPSDFLGVLTVFGITVVIALISFIVGRMRDKKPVTAQPDKGSSQTSESVTLEVHDSLHGCPDTWLHGIADGQVKRVWELVEVTATNVWQNQKSNLDAAIPAIRWGVALKNNSVFPISLDGNIEGFLFFEGHKLGEQRFELVNHIKDLPHLVEGQISFEQRVSKLEADFIKSTPKGKFSFQELQIHIKGGQGFEQISSHRLIVPDSFNVGLDQISDKTTQAVAQEIEPLTEERDSLKVRLEELSPLAGDLVIERGLYGVPGIHEEDVTDILAKMVATNTLSLDGYYNDYLPDKVKGERKRLQISYSHNGVPFSVTIPENTKITLPIAYRGPLRGLRPR